MRRSSSNGCRNRCLRREALVERRTNINELKRTRREVSLRTRWTRIGAMRARPPRRKSGLRNCMARCGNGRASPYLDFCLVDR